MFPKYGLKRPRHNGACDKYLISNYIRDHPIKLTL